MYWGLQCGGQRGGRLWGDSGSQEGDRIRAHGERLYRLFAHRRLANRADRSSAAGTNRTSTPSSNLSSLSRSLSSSFPLHSPHLTLSPTSSLLPSHTSFLLSFSPYCKPHLSPPSLSFLLSRIFCECNPIPPSSSFPVFYLMAD